MLRHGDIWRRAVGAAAAVLLAVLLWWCFSADEGKVVEHPPPVAAKAEGQPPRAPDGTQVEDSDDGRTLWLRACPDTDELVKVTALGPKFVQEAPADWKPCGSDNENGVVCRVEQGDRWLIQQGPFQAVVRAGDLPSLPTSPADILDCELRCSLRLGIAVEEECGPTGYFKLVAATPGFDYELGLLYGGEWSTASSTLTPPLPCVPLRLEVGGPECATYSTEVILLAAEQPVSVVVRSSVDQTLCVRDAVSKEPLSEAWLQAGGETGPVTGPRVDVGDDGCGTLTLPADTRNWPSVYAPGHAPTVVSSGRYVRGGPPVDIFLSPTVPTRVSCYLGQDPCPAETALVVDGFSTDTWERTCTHIVREKWECPVVGTERIRARTRAQGSLFISEEYVVDAGDDDIVEVRIPGIEGRVCASWSGDESEVCDLKVSAVSRGGSPRLYRTEVVPGKSVSVQGRGGEVLEALLQCPGRSWSGSLKVLGQDDPCQTVSLSEAGDLCVNSPNSCTAWRLSESGKVSQVNLFTGAQNCIYNLPVGPWIVACSPKTEVQMEVVVEAGLSVDVEAPVR